MNETIRLIAAYVSILGGIIASITLLNTIRILRNAKEEKKRLKQKVIITLKNYDKNKEIVLPGTLIKAEFLRSEILGRIGMIPMREKNKRFEIKYINSKEFIEQLDEIKESKTKNELIIPCSITEIDQFDMK